MKKLLNKVVLVTGSSIGIGKAIAEAFANEGAEVIVVSHNSTEEGLATADNIVNSGGKAIYIQADLSNQKGVDLLFEKISQYYTSIDVLVNNVGHAFSTPYEELTEETMIRDIKSNLMATVLCSKKVKEFMSKGHIINTSSIRGIDYSGRSHLMGYCAAKAAVNSFTKNLALQYAPDILVNAVAPGYVMTDMTRRNLSDEQIKELESQIPTGRLQTADDIAALTAFLCSEFNQSINGQLIAVDGGLTCR